VITTPLILMMLLAPPVAVDPSATEKGDSPSHSSIVALSLPTKSPSAESPSASPSSSPAAGSRDIVVLVHGLGRTKLSMRWLGRHFARNGYEVLPLSYPSTRLNIAASAENLRAQLEPRLSRCTGQVHFVAHSLGALVVRAYLQGQRPPNLGRVVMIGPPNQGSEVADRLRRNPVYRLITGPAGQELGTDPASPPHTLGPVDYEVGIIAGRLSLNPLFGAWLAGDDDGKVSVARTAVDGQRDLLVVRWSHTYLIRSPAVAEQALHFIAHGAFLRPTK
jgi:pimeloyl-ACP methyl ester carboxylesterase